MNCHSQIFANSAFLEPVRESFRTGQSIRWTRVHDLPDFVYFDHSIHVNKGVGCTTCHGPVDKMAYVFQEQSLQMEWCLGCAAQALPARAAGCSPSCRPPPIGSRWARGRCAIQKLESC
jgi:hypothetical protein